MILPRLAFLLLITALLAAVATVAGARQPDGRRTVVVADAAAPRAAALAARRAAGPGTELRFPRTPTEQLSVTHLFAVRGYDIVAIGLSHEIAIDPVAQRFPDVRFTVRDTPASRTGTPATR
jgi:hypothetical protein